MSGWVPMDAAWWPSIVDSLAKPWPREAILQDLRWWSDAERMGRATRPGCRALAERWGVTHWAARQALLSEDEWADPSSPHTGRTPAAQSPHGARTPDDGATPTPEDIPHTGRTETAHAPHARRPTRDDLTLHPTPTPTPVGESTARATPLEVEPTPPRTADIPSAVPPGLGGAHAALTTKALPGGRGDPPPGEARSGADGSHRSHPPGGSSQPRTLQRGTEPAGGTAFTPTAAMPGASALLAAATDLAQSSTAIPITLDRTARHHLAKLEAGRVTPDDLRAVWQWAAESEDAEAERLRGRGYHVEWRILAEGQSWAFRLGQARAWLGRGKRTAPETRARGKPDLPTSSIAGLLDRLSAHPEPIDIIEVPVAKLEDHRGRV